MLIAATALYALGVLSGALITAYSLDRVHDLSSTTNTTALTAWSLIGLLCLITSTNHFHTARTYWDTWRETHEGNAPH